MKGVVYRNGQPVSAATRSNTSPAARTPAAAAVAHISKVADVPDALRLQIEAAERKRYREVLLKRAASERLNWEMVQRLIADE